MKNLKDVQPALDAYHDEYRNPKHSRLQRSGPYALVANAPTPPGVELAGGWPGTWPNTDSPGVYFVFDAKLDLLYVGKASNKLGYRLSAHFQGGKADPACRIVDEWSENPAYVATVPVPTSSRFEALSLEGYLIENLKPPDNRIGKLQ